MANTVYQSQLLEPGFWAIEENGVRCFLVEGKEEAMLVDTGFGTGDLKAFVQTLTSLPVKFPGVSALPLGELARERLRG